VQMSPQPSTIHAGDQGTSPTHLTFMAKQFLISPGLMAPHESMSYVMSSPPGTLHLDLTGHFTSPRAPQLSLSGTAVISPTWSHLAPFQPLYPVGSQVITNIPLW
jgi:hypothetical protein